MLESITELTEDATLNLNNSQTADNDIDSDLESDIVQEYLELIREYNLTNRSENRTNSDHNENTEEHNEDFQTINKERSNLNLKTIGNTILDSPPQGSKKIRQCNKR